MRLFGAGDLHYVILQLLEEKPSHGYEIIKSIYERLGGTYAPSPGLVYPTLTTLEKLGYATVTTVGTRKHYTITGEGSKTLVKNNDLVDALFAKMDLVRAKQRRDHSSQIERAAENFHMVLWMKKGPLDTEQICAITDIIDAAVRQIERI